ncbi:hypothetical protein DTO280E4_4254 [Paecilomyces variotii]|nr:hypothetical protein DTO280E4_4254 [Paecilomyces variotii]
MSTPQQINTTIHGAIELHWIGPFPQFVDCSCVHARDRDALVRSSRIDRCKPIRQVVTIMTPRRAWTN